jgi:hypothetical protein
VYVAYYQEEGKVDTQFDAPRMTLCVAITEWDSLENTQFVVVLTSFVISSISGDLLFLSISASLPSWMSCI